MGPGQSAFLSGSSLLVLHTKPQLEQRPEWASVVDPGLSHQGGKGLTWQSQPSFLNTCPVTSDTYKLRTPASQQATCPRLLQASVSLPRCSLGLGSWICGLLRRAPDSAPATAQHSPGPGLAPAAPGSKATDLKEAGRWQVAEMCIQTPRPLGNKNLLHSPDSPP